MIQAEDVPFINDALSMLRFSYEDLAQREESGRAMEALQREYLQLEGLRFKYSRRASLLYRRRRFDELTALTYELVDGLSRMVENSHSGNIAAVVPLVRRTSRRDPATPFSAELDRVIEARPRAYDLLVFLVDSMKSGIKMTEPSLFDETGPDGNRQRDASRLKRMVPAQKVAPLQFEVIDGQLSVLHAPSDIRREASGIVPVAKQDLLARGQELIKSLKQSNCDRRLLEKVEELQAQLDASDNAIQLGLTNLTCQAMSHAFNDELPSALAALIQSQTVGVGMYVAQFPDWVTFSEQAITTSISSKDATSLIDALRSLISETEKQPEIADPEVPRSLSKLKQLIDDPRRTSKQAILAVVRTLENLVIRVFQFGADFLDQTAKKSIDKLSTMSARLATAALLAIALTTASNLTPVASKIEGLRWIKDASEIVQRQMDTLR